ncbi:MAG: hypothetical protein QOJ53_2237 [Sphingomonadales bacterium]|nr:hypothetical protein [Sphingomonadales bacterium]MEA3042407.1 hypothetical protein [Sphingomonadales bacterium]MEA3047905.1 hypothetical protein [Sphingomonadales bacterium]
MAKKYGVGRSGAVASSPFLLSLKGPAEGERAVLQNRDGAIFVAKRRPPAGNER